ncbi:MAG: 50S ribosomal protein L4 [Desulfurococcaceae archaeon]
MTWEIVATLVEAPRTAKVYNVDGTIVGELRLPPVFSMPVRRDIINRAFLAAFTASLQPKGRDPMAGKRTSARSWGVGHGLARVPRQYNGRARFVPSARGGRATFPPRVDERLREEVNKRERALAIASALAATASVELVRARGHVFGVDSLPIVLVDEAEKAVDSSSNARALLSSLKVWEDVARCQEGTKIRAGKGKMRGRRYREPRGPLFVISSYSVPLARAVRNFPGVDVATPANLGILHLAPGGVPGRLTIFTKSALEALGRKFEVLSL